MQRNGGARARVARKAATTALSQMAESAKRFRDYTSSDEEPVAKLTRKSVADVPHEFRNRKPEWHVAIDFGTTYTTVAWYRRGTPIDKIFTVDNFPGEKQHHLTNRQIPTEVWYPRKDARPLGHIKARDIRMRFGNEVHRIAEDDEDMDYHEVYDETGRVTMMKLLLDKTDYAQASKERLHETLESIIDQGHIKNNEDVFFHFFREIFRATRTRLGPDFEDGSSGMFRI
jgi:molecular chaperone DnaK (HSP70)